MKTNIYILFTLTLMLQGCSTRSDEPADDFYRQEMRFFVQQISTYSKNIDNSFIIIPQNGNELVSMENSDSLKPAVTYLNAIDGVGREDLFYGYNNDNQPTPFSETEYLLNYLEVCKQNSIKVLTTDYCWDHTKMDDSYARNAQYNFISFAAPDRELSVIPDYPVTLYNENAADILKISDARNFLYLINPGNFTEKVQFLEAITATNYDVVIIDAFFDDLLFGASEIMQLKIKNNGGKRLVIAYMSIGEAENYRYYWKSSWRSGSPDWIVKENPDWEGNFKVKYWETEWQKIILGNENSYIDKIINAAFDGVYLDIIDAFEFFEK